MRFLPQAPATDDASRDAPWAGRVFLLVLVVGCGLRAARLLGTGFEWAEYPDLYAQQQIVETGLPLLPTGELWPYGGWLLWLGAAANHLGGLGVFANRLPNAVLGVLAIVAIWRSARRILGPVGGVTAAACVALHPGLVQWTAHVAPFGALTLFTTLAVDRWIAWVVEEDESAAWPAGIWFALGAICHPVIWFLGGGLVVGTVAVRGVRWLTSRRVLAVGTLCGAAVVGLALVISLGDASGHPFLHGGHGAAERGLGAHGFWSPWHRVPFALAAVGAGTALVRWLGSRETGRDAVRSARVTSARGIVVCSVAWGVAFVGLVFFSPYGAAVHLLPLVPLVALAAAYGMEVGCENATGRVLGGTIAVGLLAAHGYLARDAFREALDRGEDVARLVAYVERDAREGDVSFGGGAALALHSNGRLDDHPLFRVSEDASAPVSGNRPVRTVRDVAALLEPGRGAWLLVSREDLRRGELPRGVIRWLTARTEFVAAAAGRSLYRLRRR